MRRAYTIIAATLSLILLSGCGGSDLNDTTSAAHADNVSTAVQNDTTADELSSESFADTVTTAADEGTAVDPETLEAQTSDAAATPSVETTTALTDDENDAPVTEPAFPAVPSAPESTTAVETTTAFVKPVHTEETTGPAEVTTAVFEETTGPSEETTRLEPEALEPAVSETEALPPVTTSEDITLPEPEASAPADVTQAFDELPSLPVIGPVETDETEEPAQPLPAVPEIDLDQHAEKLMKPIIEKTVAIIDADRMDIGTVSYPFEKRDARASLTASQADIYDELVGIVTAREPYIFTEGWKRTYSDFIIAANTMFRDYPQLSFYSKLREVKQYSRVMGIEVVYFIPYNENMPLEGNESVLDFELGVMDAVCDYIVSNIPDDYSTYDKYRYLAAVVSYIVEYDYEYEGGISSENAYGAIISGMSICRGYAKAFEYLCERADLYCRFVQGSNTMGDVHMWNLVRLESGTYHVDVTWSDTTYGDTLGSGWMQYFMVTQTDTEKNHIIDDGTVATGTRIEHN